MWQEILEAFHESLITLPVLLAVYVLIEVIESKATSRWKYNKVLKGKFAPLIGSAVGLVPQCGFSVVATDLYTKNMISVGTLLAVYLCTSDEALPIMISHPESISYLFILLAIKFVVACMVGYILYFVTRNRNRKSAYSINQVVKGNYVGIGEIYVKQDKNLNQNYLVADIHMEAEQDTGCCGHHIEVDGKQNFWKSYLLHPLLHSLKIFGFILAVNLVLTVVMHYAGDSVTAFLNSAYYAQPFVASLIGLIPNCASSAILANLFVEGALSFGACVAGLCANAGIALAVLIKQNKSKKDTLTIIALLYTISCIVGTIISLIMRAI